MAVMPPEYLRAKQSDDVVDAIEAYGDGKYTIRYNIYTGYDVVLRRGPNTWADEKGRRHLRQVWLPVMTVMQPVTEEPYHYVPARYIIGELDRTHIRNLRKKLPELMKEYEEHNRQLAIDKEEYARKKEAEGMAAHLFGRPYITAGIDLKKDTNEQTEPTDTD